MSIAARCTVQLADETSGRQRLQISALPGEVLDQVETVHQYGFASSPLPGALAVAIMPHGARDSAIVVGTDDARHRPKGLQAGEACVYTNAGNYVLLKADGSITIKAPGGVKIIGDLLVTGSITATAGPMTTDGLVLDDHKHTGVSAGADETGGPTNV